jgi:cell wall-associated NlpC family hydrolase
VRWRPRNLAHPLRLSLAVLVLGVAVAASGCLAPAAPPHAPSGPPPAPSAGSFFAVMYAEAQIGKPYCYAGTGPSCFDCSGLTMKAWQAGGVSMPHFSGSQFAMFPTVPLNQLAPGDLLFPADPDQHVAMYIGSGLLVHATKPGDVVRIDTLPDVGITQAVRPT